MTDRPRQPLSPIEIERRRPLPPWLLDVSPFTHVPNAPAEAIEAAPVLLLALAAVAAAVGTLALRRRSLLLPV